MIHYFYVIENLINGKVYAGKHSTKNFNDGYMGSGKLLKRAIKKHGIEKFQKHVLVTFDTAGELNEFEKQIINEDFVNDSNTYNLTTGGYGSFFSCNQFLKDHPEKKQKQLLAAQKRAVEVHQSNPILQQKMKQIHSDTLKRLRKQGIIPLNYDWTGRHHKESSKLAIGRANSIHQTGEGNSQFGTMWISNYELKTSRKIQKTDIHIWIQQGWISGRKMKW